MSEPFIFLAPTGNGGVPAPAPTPQETARWAVDELADRAPVAVYCHPRDLAALASTLLGPRCAVLPHGGPQPGTLWLQIGGGA